MTSVVALIVLWGNVNELPNRSAGGTSVKFVL